MCTSKSIGRHPLQRKGCTYWLTYASFKIVLICLIGFTTGELSAQIMQINGDRTPCPGQSSYQISTSYLWCEDVELYGMTITPIDDNGNSLTLGWELGTIDAEFVSWTQNNNVPGPYNAIGYQVDITWNNPVSTVYDKVRLCFTARCFNQTTTEFEWFSDCIEVEIQTIRVMNLTGPTDVDCCAGEAVTYCAEPDDYSSYEWTIPPGWTVQGGTTGPCITVIPRGSGTVGVRPYDAGCDYQGPRREEYVSASICSGVDIEIAQVIPCDGSSQGALNVILPPGFNPSLVTWTDENDVPYSGLDGNLSPTGLAPGVYKVRLLDQYCSAVASVELTEASDDPPLGLTFDLTPYDASGWKGEVGDCYFHIKVTGSGGYPPYTYEWALNGQTLDYINVEPGTYEVTVTDARGCTLTASITADPCPSPPGKIGDARAIPNPFADILSAEITLNDGGNVRTTVHDINGTVMHDQDHGFLATGTHVFPIDLSSSPDGLYFLSFIVDSEQPYTLLVEKQ